MLNCHRCFEMFLAPLHEIQPAAMLLILLDEIRPGRTSYKAFSCRSAWQRFAWKESSDYRGRRSKTGRWAQRALLWGGWVRASGQKAKSQVGSWAFSRAFPDALTGIVYVWVLSVFAALLRDQRVFCYTWCWVFKDGNRLVAFDAPSGDCADAWQRFTHENLSVMVAVLDRSSRENTLGCRPVLCMERNTIYTGHKVISTSQTVGIMLRHRRPRDSENDPSFECQELTRL